MAEDTSQVAVQGQADLVPFLDLLHVSYAKSKIVYANSDSICVTGSTLFKNYSAYQWFTVLVAGTHFPEVISTIYSKCISHSAVPC